MYIFIYISSIMICATNHTSLIFFISSWKNVWKWQSKIKEEYGSCISQANKVIDEVDLWWYEMKLEIHTLTISVNEHHHFGITMMKVLPGAQHNFLQHMFANNRPWNICIPREEEEEEAEEEEE